MAANARGKAPGKGEPEMIAALAMGRSYKQTAAMAGVNESTVQRRMRDPAFRQKVSALRNQMYRETAGMLARSMAAAVMTLAELLKDETKSLRLSAARAILDFGSRYAELLDLAERLEELEQRLSEQKRDEKAW